LIIGFAKAMEIALAERDEEARRLVALRTKLQARLETALPGRVRLNGHPDLRLAGNLNLTFRGVDGDRLMADLGGLAVSSGSACSSAAAEPSAVLLALGLRPEEARASIRFGLGRDNDEADVELAVQRVVEAVEAQGHQAERRAADAPE
jgi:cysteine desulfurase